MKSSIKIDFIDRGYGRGIEPLIKVNLVKSEDPRDTLLAVLFESTAFEERFGGKYLQIEYYRFGNKEHDEGKTIYLFKPESEQEEKIRYPEKQEHIKERGHSTNDNVRMRHS